MEDILKARLRSFHENLQTLIDSGQSTLLEISSNSHDIHNVELVQCKLQLAVDRLVTEIYNYFKMVTTPSADDIALYTQTQIQAEELVAELKAKICSFQKPAETASKNDNLNVTSKLPKMELAKFSGDVLKWHQFWDQFSSNVDSRKICDVDKLLYLQSVLQGDAKRAIDGLDITNKNYEIAVATLKERYGKPGTIIDAHYAALYRIKPAGKSVNDCRRVFNEIQGHLRVLSSLGEDVNHNHLRVTIMQKFSEDLIYELRMRMKTESDTIDEIRQQIEQIISAREMSTRMKDELFSQGASSSSNTDKDRFSLETLHVNTDNQLPQKRSSSLRINPKDSKEKYRRNNDSKRNFDRYKVENRKYEDTRKRQYSAEDERKEPQIKRRKASCIFCGNGHYNDECMKFKTIEDRKRKLEGRCFNCFAKGHNSRECRSHMKCYHCGKFGLHNRALCPSKEPVKSNTPILHVGDAKSDRGVTVLQTAVVHVRKVGSLELVPCRVLLDCGSQRTYITSQLARKLGLTALEVNNLSVFTFGASQPTEMESPVVTFEVISRTNQHQSLYANVVPHITSSVPSLPRCIFDQVKNSLMNDLVLADDTTQGDRVDILLGNDYYFSSVKGEKREIAKNLYLVNSVFGWIWSGWCSPDKDVNPEKYLDKLSVLTYFQSDIEWSYFCEPDPPLRVDNMKRLWDLESIGITDSPKASRDDEAIRKFNDTTKFFGGRYHVKWPWVDYPPVLSSNFGLAFGRLKGLIKRLDQNTISTYDKIIQEQLDLGIIEVVSEPNRSTEHPVHYLPHHCVPQTDKLRLVYDASSKTKGNKSLNECLYRGPLMLEDLTELLIRFRENKIGIVADVEKAFLQIALQDEDRDVTRFLWLRNINEEVSSNNIIHYRFCRVPFGVISSPFLLNATIRNHLRKGNGPFFKLIAEDLYVDNLVTGANSIDDAKAIYRDARSAFMDLSMNLRQWNSNSSEFVNQMPEELRDKQVKNIKVLGLDWDLEKDEIGLKFSLKEVERCNVNTKRDVLRIMASVFDPCGFVVPLVLPSKLFIQSLWSQKVDWDTKLTKHNQEEWYNAQKALSYVEHIKIPRYFDNNIKHKRSDKIVTYELHTFTDSSLQAYAAAVYIRCVCDEDVAVSFVMGKSRLVCKKEQSNLQIPKLELLGALIGSRLMKKVKKSLRIPIAALFLWTDSQIVVSWCITEKLLPPFVSRRVEEIKSNPNISIRHVPSQLNPADVATRPNASTESAERWLKGPDFLYSNSSSWPPNVDERSDVYVLAQNISPGQGPSDQVQDLNVDESVQNIESEGSNRSKEASTFDDLEQIRQAQRECYSKELNGQVTDVVRSLDLYKDEKGLLRCRGRLSNTVWTDDQKYPILLPRKHQLTTKIIDALHKSNYHVGVSHTLSLLRKKYWVPRGRTEVQKVIKQCIACRKYSGGPYKLPPMAPLPAERVTYSNPFSFTGVDYFGPIMIDAGGSLEKRWVCLYTCLAVRAIHLEVVNDLTAEECLLALRRFVSSRNVPKLIISDNALQFKLAADVLTNEYCVKNGIKWKFIPELAPWFGGFYERLIGLVKNCLKKTVDKHLLNQAQLSTTMKEIEAVVNSRPLTTVGEELAHVLTPADFLYPGGFSFLDPSDTEHLENSTVTKSNLIEGWKRGQQILKEYVEMFSNQYLTSLRERQNKHRQSRTAIDLPAKVGDVVQVKGDKNRAFWKVGKISAVIKGADNNIRVAKVTISPNETLTRSVSHLYPLEITDDNSCQEDSAQTPNINVEPQSDEVTRLDSDNDDTQVTSKTTEREPNSQNENTRPRRRLAAQRARDKLRKWTAQLFSWLQ